MENEQTNTEAPRRDMIAEAEAAAVKLAAMNKELAEKLDRLERLQVEHTLGGRATVNNTPREDTPEEYAEKALRGEIGGNEL